MAERMILDDQQIVITGGTGSLGQALAARLLSGRHGAPRKVVVLSRDEAKQHEMRLAYLHKETSTDEVIYRNFSRRLEFRIGDVRSYADVCSALRDADIVIHAAALKQVPTCEYFPEQALLTNSLGAANVVRAIREHGYPIQAVVSVSTDKACKPVNVMGMTKALQERIFAAGNILVPQTRFVCVRYGNVIASRGSVVPAFLEQIARGGPVTVTVPEMTRFLVSFDEAVDAVIEALSQAKPGETYIPAAPSATVLNIARALMARQPVEVKITGIRPGEKLHETLVSEEECRHTVRLGEYFVIRPMLPELQQSAVPNEPVVAREITSADRPLSLDETRALFVRHQIVPTETTPRARADRH